MSEKFEKLEKLRVPALDEILGVPFKVLKDGFVRVIDYLGSDESIVQAARVSYGKGTKKIREDEALIRYLLRHQHTTPFEMCEIKLHVTRANGLLEAVDSASNCKCERILNSIFNCN